MEDTAHHFAGERPRRPDLIEGGTRGGLPFGPTRNPTEGARRQKREDVLGNREDLFLNEEAPDVTIGIRDPLPVLVGGFSSWLSGRPR